MSRRFRPSSDAHSLCSIFHNSNIPSKRLIFGIPHLKLQFLENETLENVLFCETSPQNFKEPYSRQVVSEIGKETKNQLVLDS